MYCVEFVLPVQNGYASKQPILSQIYSNLFLSLFIIMGMINGIRVSHTCCCFS